jgi:hypothetical protein
VPELKSVGVEEQKRRPLVELRRGRMTLSSRSPGSSSRGPWRRASRRTGASRGAWRACFGLVDDEVAVVEGLDAEEVELEVGGGIEGGGELVEVVLEEARVEALDLDAALEVLAEGALVEVLQGLPMPSRTMSQPSTSS